MKKLFGLLILAAVALTLVTVNYRSRSTAAPGEWPAEAIEFGTLVETVSAGGTIQPKDMLMVGGDAAGRVIRVFVEAGQTVKAGDPLCQIDDQLPNLRVQQARLAVELAQADAQRAEAGRDSAALAAQYARDGSGQIQQVQHIESAEYQRRAAEASLRAAQIRVREAQAAQQLAEVAADQTLIRAPIAGVVLDKRIAAGQYIAPPASAHLFTLAPDLDHLQITALVAEGDIARLRIGQPATFTVTAFPDQTFTGKVTRLANVPAGGPGAVQYAATIDAMNSKDAETRDWKLRAGMPAAVDCVVRRHDQVWKLPVAATAVQLDETHLSEAAKKKLARWKARGDRGDWQRVWLMTHDRGAWPLFVRIGGKTAQGDAGIQDATYVEILAWDPEESSPESATPPRVLVGAPESARPAKPGLKLF